ncbi:hypothetical protein ElyMa_000798900 [Elysia marginata]|uniref:Uncharacterized protein n=1 Tax=Elysia marginata TaxID=1093978 RepID=A0AAV4GX03_9GAST|nr:hypothetical protein ElyMa_000798900 [Elysia marginata]
MRVGAALKAPARAGRARHSGKTICLGEGTLNNHLSLLPCRGPSKSQRLRERTPKENQAETGGTRPKGANKTERRNCRACKLWYHVHNFTNGR